jgi:hypothetical protein
MKWYFYLNYFIFRFYEKKWGKLDNPVLTAFLATCLLVHLNIFTIVASYTLIVDFWTVPELSGPYRVNIIAQMAFLGIVNYLLLYRKKKYVKIFDEFKKNEDYYKKWNKSSLLYIILSVVFMLATLIIADWRNRNLGMFN